MLHGSNDDNREVKGLQAQQGALDRKVFKVCRVNKVCRVCKAYKEPRYSTHPVVSADQLADICAQGSQGPSGATVSFSLHL